MALEILERLIRNAEERADAAEVYARSLEQKMDIAIAEARQRADEHLRRVEVLEDLLRRAEGERAGLIQALQEAIRAQQLQVAAPVAIAQAEADRERREGFAPAERPTTASSVAGGTAEATTRTAFPTGKQRPAARHQNGKPKTASRLGAWLWGTPRKRGR